MDATASGAQGIAGRNELRERSTGARTNGAANCLRWNLSGRTRTGKTSGRTGADGEIVWSRRPQAGVKSCGDAFGPTGPRCIVNPQGDGGKVQGSPRRSPISRKPPRGESRMIRLPCGLLVRFVRTTAGAIGARLSPRPLLLRRAKLTQTSGASRRENAGACPLAV